MNLKHGIFKVGIYQVCIAVLSFLPASPLSPFWCRWHSALEIYSLF